MAVHKRRNWLFAESDDGGERAAAIYTLTNGWHVCIEVDNPPRVELGDVDKPGVVVRGM